MILCLLCHLNITNNSIYRMFDHNFCKSCRDKFEFKYINNNKLYYNNYSIISYLEYLDKIKEDIKKNLKRIKFFYQ